MWLNSLTSKSSNRLTKIFFITLTLALSGCSKTKEVAAVILKDRGQDYTSIKAYPSLQIPKDIKCEPIANTYRIPEQTSPHGR